MQASQHVFPSQHGCGDVKGQILLDPVDGFDPFGWFPNFITTPGEYLNYAMPTLGTYHRLITISTPTFSLNITFNKHRKNTWRHSSSFI
jgi:hypothetical protein